LGLLVQLNPDIRSLVLPQDLRGPITFCCNTVTTIFVLILLVVFAPAVVVAAAAAAAIPREPTKCAGLLRFLLCDERAMGSCLRAGPRAGPAPAEEGEAWVGAVVREDAGAELRVVRGAGDVRCRAAHEVHLWFVWLHDAQRNVWFVAEVFFYYNLFFSFSSAGSLGTERGVGKVKFL
jgi:hypothetical protein